MQKTLSEIQKYFQQEKELFGNILYPESNPKPMKKKLPTEEIPSSPQTQNFPAENWVSSDSLQTLQQQICECQKCSLGKTRNKFVFGVGNPKADIMVVGEAPGADEDLKGEPFVGRAGQLFTKILEAIQLKREEVFICNILKCRPPNNRDPLLSEVEQCEPYLWKQIDLVQPKFILCLGRISAQVLLKTNDSLTKLREKVHTYRGIPLIVTYHPAALLRNPHWKKPTWEDVQKLQKMYNEKINTKP